MLRREKNGTGCTADAGPNAASLCIIRGPIPGCAIDFRSAGQHPVALAQTGSPVAPHHTAPPDKVTPRGTMGRDAELFVDAAAISRHLLCSICHGVLERPVQTACEHLFCEDCLLAWLCRKATCPVCTAVTEPEAVKRAPRAIVGLIDDLEVRCDHCECDWTGPHDQLSAHLDECCHAPRAELLQRLSAKQRQLEDARRTIADRDREIVRLEAALKARRDGSARDADNARRRLRQLERDADEDPRRSPGTTQSQRSLRRERFRKARSDRATDVTRIMSLRDSLETLRLHAADDEPAGDRC